MGKGKLAPRQPETPIVTKFDSWTQFMWGFWVPETATSY